MTTNQDRPDAISILQDAFENPDRITLSHVRALRALRQSPRSLTYAQLARELNLSGRQTRRIVGELERRGLIERDEHGRGSTRPDRFEVPE